MPEDSTRTHGLCLLRERDMEGGSQEYLEEDDPHGPVEGDSGPPGQPSPSSPPSQAPSAPAPQPDDPGHGRKCCQGCDKPSTDIPLQCKECHGFLHRSCGRRIDEHNESIRICTPCADRRSVGPGAGQPRRARVRRASSQPRADHAPAADAQVRIAYRRIRRNANDQAKADKRCLGAVPKQLHTKYTDCCRPILKRFEEASAADDQAEMYSALHDLTSAQIMLLSVPRGGSGSRNRRRNITQVSRNMDSFLARDQQRPPPQRHGVEARVKATPRRGFGISRRKKDYSLPASEERLRWSARDIQPKLFKRSTTLALSILLRRARRRRTWNAYTHQAHRISRLCRRTPLSLRSRGMTTSSKYGNRRWPTDRLQARHSSRETMAYPCSRTLIAHVASLS